MQSLFQNATEILLLIFIVITFIQSGLDKVLDWSGNLSWLKDHFSKSLLKNAVPVALALVLVLELVAGFLCLAGAYEIICSGQSSIAMYGALLAGITLLMLLFGQRVAKDYEGAKTIVIYFIPVVFLIYLLQI